jgi:hypothetical protein
MYAPPFMARPNDTFDFLSPNSKGAASGLRFAFSLQAQFSFHSVEHQQYTSRGILHLEFNQPLITCPSSTRKGLPVAAAVVFSTVPG